MAFYPDEKDKPRRRPFIASGELWLGVFTVLISLTLAFARFGCWGKVQRS